MRKIRKITITIIFLSGCLAANAGQQNDLEDIVKEIRYLKEVVKEIKQRNKKDKSKITFNYDALIKQLEAAENGTTDYLNKNIGEIRTSPPKVYRRVLSKVRK